MKKMKKLLSVVLSIVMLMSITAGLDLTAYAETSGYYTYDVIDGDEQVIAGDTSFTITDVHAKITDCDTSISGNIEIPPTIGDENYPVTAIETAAFEGCTNLTSITIPDGVKFIGSYAFSGCTSLKSVTIPDSVTIIFDNAFNGCTSLESVTIGNGVTNIYESAFEGCTSLTSITIPEGVTTIENNTFKDCTALATVTLPSSLTKIEKWAFNNCNVKDVYYPLSSSEFHNLARNDIMMNFNSGLKYATVHAYYNCTHSYSESDITVITEPTCVKEGTGTAVCTICGVTVDVTIPATGKHRAMIESGEVPPTCTEPGRKAIYKCETCDLTAGGEEIAALGHSYSEDDITVVTKPTCVKDGTGTVICTTCNQTVNVTIPATGVHNYTELISAKQEPTCTEKGKEAVYKCATCDLTTGGEEIAANGHTEVVDKAVAATCTATGLTEGSHCSVCNEVTTKQEVTPALGHDYAKTVVAPTTTSQGYTTYTCTRCGDTYKADYTAVLPSTDTNTNTNSNTSTTDNSSSTTDSTATPTAEESKIAEQYGVDIETARLIIEVLNKYNVSQQTAALTETAMTSSTPKDDGDYAGVPFGLLRSRATNLKKNSITVKWNKVSGADGYIIYGSKCGKGKKYKKIATVSAKKLSYTQKKLKKGTYYKYNVVAYKNVNGIKVTIAASKKIHATTKGGKYGVAKSVKLNKSKVTLKKGKKFQIKASEVKQDKKIMKHRGICYESSNANVATVNSKGKITAKKKGKCTIYVYAQNGVYKTITVTVK